MRTLTESESCITCHKEAPCFQKLTENEMELILNSKTQVLFHKGENITKQGAFSSYILFIFDGLAKQYVESSSNHNFNLRLVRSGEFVGLSAIYNNSTFNYSVVALKDTLACLIEKNAIVQLMKNNGEFAYSISKRYFENDSLLYKIMGNVIYKQMNGRLADSLLYLSSNEFIDDDVFIHLSRKEIAEFSGMSTESTVKLLKSFEKENLIKLEEKNIIILNRNGLEEISRVG